ncbi:hypothetical protein EG328_002569 [Venturia inaequalis]|uniref:DUF7708 domain-containing protein n=1 Tax=Venturia inaequalis TaxID=5025 RepID=A0A8H3UWA1_VENIN|nr:hypothetical protein EG328_002569 [Venturia inaequalis]
MADRTTDVFRRGLETEVVVRYMQENLRGSIHPALDVKNLEYTGVGYQWLPESSSSEGQLLERETELMRQQRNPDIDLPKIYMGSDKARAEFLRSMEEYQLGAEKPYRVDMKVQDRHSWTDVIEIAQKVQDQYSNHRPDSAGERIKNVARKFCDHSATLEMYVAHLPGISPFSSVLCGGFKLILGATSRLGKVRAYVQDALGRIPEALEEVQERLKIFYDERLMHKANSALYVSILDVLGRILSFCKKNAIKKIIHAVLDADHDSKAIQCSLERMKIRVDDFNHQAKTCHMRLSSYTLLHQSVRHRELTHRLNSVQGTTQLLLCTIEEVRATVQQISADWKADMMRKMAERKAVARETLTVKDLMFVPGYRREMSEEDYTQVLSSSKRMLLKDQNRASALMRDSRVIDWIARSVSTMLLVNGRSTTQKRSPVSFFCATVVVALEDACEAGDGTNENGGLFVLSFFCGEHAILGEDDCAHPLGIVLSLLGQLLECYPAFEVDPNMRRKWKRVQERGFKHLRSVCKLFEALIMALGPDARVHIIVDAVHYYEDKRRREDLRTITQSLRFSASSKFGPVVKVLFSAPASCSYIHKEFDDDEVLNMRRFYPNQVAVNTANWKRDVMMKVDEPSSGDEDEDGDEENMDSRADCRYSERAGDGVGGGIEDTEQEPGSG